MKQQASDAFRDPTALTTWTKRLLYLQIVVAVVALISGGFEASLLQDFKNGNYSSQEDAVAAGEASDMRQGLIGIVEIAILIASGILILKWIHRANSNARQLGAMGMEFTPGWSIGWYFIPFANLWMPYQAMKEIWKASSNPKDWKSLEAPSLLGWWWLVWIVCSVLGNVSLRLAFKADGIDELIASNFVGQLAEVTGLPLSVIFLVMVNRIHSMQMTHHARSTQVASSG